MQHIHNNGKVGKSMEERNLGVYLGHKYSSFLNILSTVISASVSMVRTEMSRLGLASVLSRLREGPEVTFRRISKDQLCLGGQLLWPLSEQSVHSYQ